MEITCAILSGGKSTRMGRDKATMKVGESTLVGHTHAVASKVFTDIIIVSSLHTSIENVPARIVHDILPMPGSLTGIASALAGADTPYVFVVGCDMPFLTPEAMRYMVGEVHGEQVVIPRTDAGFEPLHAIYHRSCLSTMLTCIERGHMKIERLFDFFSVRAVLANPLFFKEGVSIFTNVNTREDLRRAERAL